MVSSRTLAFVGLFCFVGGGPGYANSDRPLRSWPAEALGLNPLVAAENPPASTREESLRLRVDRVREWYRQAHGLDDVSAFDLVPSNGFGERALVVLNAVISYEQNLAQISESEIRALERKLSSYLDRPVNLRSMRDRDRLWDAYLATISSYNFRLAAKDLIE